ncbi:MAG: hypothetical protein VX475_21305 [Myxococcota bacterium]|nr:hypothetical protein [Myxococcota bacterium]
MSSDQEFSDSEHPPDFEEDDSSQEEGWRANRPPGFEFRLADMLQVGLPLWSMLSQHFDPARFMGWLPLLASLRSFATSIQATVKQWRLLAASGDWETINDSMEMLREMLVERGGELLDVFPEATQILRDVESIDDALTRVLDQEGGRELARSLIGRMEKQADDLVGMLLDALFSAGRELPIERTTELVRSFDHLFQKVLEEIILPRVIKADDGWRSPTSGPTSKPESKPRGEHTPDEEE